MPSADGGASRAISPVSGSCRPPGLRPSLTCGCLSVLQLRPLSCVYPCGSASSPSSPHDLHTSTSSSLFTASLHRLHIVSTLPSHLLIVSTLSLYLHISISTPYSLYLHISISTPYSLYLHIVSTCYISTSSLHYLHTSTSSPHLPGGGCLAAVLLSPRLLSGPRLASVGLLSALSVSPPSGRHRAVTVTGETVCSGDVTAASSSSAVGLQ